MMHTGTICFFLAATSLTSSSDAKAYIFAHVNKKRYQGRLSRRSTATIKLYSGYCVGCLAWNDSFPPESLGCNQDENRSSVADDTPLRPQRHLSASLDVHRKSSSLLLDDSTSHDNQLFLQQLIIVLLFLELGLGVYLLSRNRYKRKKPISKKPVEVSVEILTDDTPDLYPVSSTSFEDESPDSENDFSKIRKQNQMLQKEFASVTAFWR